MGTAKKRMYAGMIVGFTVLSSLLTYSAKASDIELKDGKLKINFNSETGAITRFEDLETGWVIDRRASLGISFRMHAPLADRRFNYIYGNKQHAVINRVS
ncbi:MAG: hypothetical protein ABUL46_06550, partial [Chitinophaga rupis]